MSIVRPERHPSADDLADLAADVLRDERAQDVRHHVHSCTRCAGLLADAERIRSLLLATDPGPMPAEVWRRLESALQVEVASRQPAVRRLPTAPPVPAWSSMIAAAAAVLLVLTGGGLLLRQIGADGGADSSSARAELSGGSAPSAVRALSAVPVTETGADYTPERLAGQVGTLLAAQADSPVKGRFEGGTEADAALPGLADPTALQRCLGALGLTDQRPVAVDLGRFQGRAAAIIVLPATGNQYEVWAVAPDCRPGADGTLYYGTVSPPG